MFTAIIHFFISNVYYPLDSFIIFFFLIQFCFLFLQLQFTTNSFLMNILMSNIALMSKFMEIADKFYIMQYNLFYLLSVMFLFLC